MRLYTVGHSTRTIEKLIAILDGAGVRALVDGRRFPGSRRHPQFGRDALAAALAEAGIAYRWVEALGGRRRRRKGSPHVAWENAGFAGYADHMDSDEFQAAARDLLSSGAATPTAVMCAEAHPSQCHRRLLSDWLTVHGAKVVHLLDEKRTALHTLTPFARVVGGERIVYDRGTQETLL